MMQGMAFGAGSEIAHTAMRSVMGGSGNQNQCQNENSNFVECLKFTSNDIQGCQNYLDLL